MPCQLALTERSDVLKDYDARIVSEQRCALGEGPAWDSERQSIAWVDIEFGKVHLFRFVDGASCSWEIAGKPSAVIVANNGCYLVPSGREILELNPDTGSISTWCKLAGEPPNNRCNDAKCDPFGDLWVGTMDDSEVANTGRLWRFDPAGKGDVLHKDIGISNTLAWDRKRGRLYFADSQIGDIFVFDYDADSGALGEKRVFFGGDSAPGIPDGSAIDLHGNLWNARWSAGCVAKVSPDGKLAALIELPVSCPTSCAFGSDGLQTLFVTSARQTLDAAGSGHREDGALLSFTADVPGAPILPFDILQRQSR